MKRSIDMQDKKNDIINRQPVSCWSFDGDANDSCGANHGQIEGSVKFVEGKFNKAIDLTSEDSGIIINNASNLGHTTFTISAWFKIPSPLPDDFYKGGTILQYGMDSGNDYGFYINDKTIVFRWSHASIVPHKFEIVPDEWYHLTGTYDKASETARLYINGNKVYERLYQKGPLPCSPAQLTIGKIVHGNGVCGKFCGFIDEVRIYDYAVDKIQVEKLYNNSVDEGIILRFSTHRNNPGSWGHNLVYYATSSFNKLHEKDKVRIDLPYIKDRNELLKVYEDGLQNNDLPEIISFWHESQRELFIRMVNENKLTPLNMFFEKYPEIRNMMDEDALETYTDEKGSIWGIPIDRAYMGFYYNKNHLKEAGIKRIPSTWEEFFLVCDKLMDAGYGSVVFDPLPANKEDSREAWLLILHCIGTQKESDEWSKNAKKGSIDFKSKVFIDGLKLYKELLSHVNYERNGSNASMRFKNGEFSIIAAASNFTDGLDNYMSPGVVSHELAPGNGVLIKDFGFISTTVKDAARLKIVFDFLKRYVEEDNIDYINERENTRIVPVNTEESNKKRNIFVIPQIKELINKSFKAEHKYYEINYLLDPKSKVYDEFILLLNSFSNGEITAEEYSDRITEVYNASDKRSFILT